MKSHRNAGIPFLASAFAFLFASLPVSTALEIGGNKDIGGSKDGIRDRQSEDAGAHSVYSDERLMKEIRNTLKSDDSLSPEARDVKVYAANGNVILKGYVASPEEKMHVEEIAKQAAHAGLIENDLKIQNQ